MLIVLNNSKQIVDFYGYCGGLYVIEKLFFIVLDVFGIEWNFDDLNIVFDIFEFF